MVELHIVLRIAVILVLFILILTLLQLWVSIHPQKYYNPDKPSSYGIGYESVSFTTSDGIKIKGWLINSSANGTVIIGHGYPFDKGNILPVVKFLYPDYNLLLYDHRYFGESSGAITTAGLREVEDVKAAAAFVRSRFGKEKSIALYGFSLSAAAMLMSKENVSAIIADSPYADLERMIKQIYSIFGPLKFPFVQLTNLLSLIFFKIHPRDISPAQAIKGSSIPILVIHGEKDTQIAVENSYALKESNPDIELWIVKNADHGEAYALHEEEYKQKIKDFLKRHMKLQ